MTPPLPQALQHPEYWSYISEGGMNLVLRYNGPTLDRDPFKTEQDQDQKEATKSTNPPSHSARSVQGNVSGEPSSTSRDSYPTESIGGRIALRISKRDNSSSRLDPSIKKRILSCSAPLASTSPDLFRDKVISPLLSPATLNHPIASSLIPKTERRKVSSSFLSGLAEQIEDTRPEQRRKDSKIDTEQDEVWLVEDLTRGNGKKTLAVEIKPKWGFLPSPAIAGRLGKSILSPKFTTSRYTMHRIFKDSEKVMKSCSDGQVTEQNRSRISPETLSKIYDPLDLYSGERERVEKALRALFEEWLGGMYSSLGEKEMSNNLKLFLDGKILDSTKQQDLSSLSNLFSDSSVSQSDRARQLSSSFVDSVLPHLLPFEGQSSTSNATSFASSLTQTPPVLHHLARLQASLDALDVRGLWNRIEKESTSTRELFSEPTIEEYQEIAEMWLSLKQESDQDPLHRSGSISSSNQTPTEPDFAFISKLTLRQSILAFLLSATFKDCSLFLSLNQITVKEEAGNALHSRFHLVDLDPKPIRKLKHYLELDLKIEQSFLEWSNHYNHQSLVDPIELIPNELFCQSLSFLRPSSIATSSAVSAKWRDVIHADSTLHQEVDLSKMGKDCEATVIVHHLNRLSSLALNRVVKISLNLDSFFESFKVDSRGVGFKNVFSLSDALQKSKNSLQELSLVLHWQKQVRGEQVPYQAVPFLLLILRSLRFFHRLVRIHIEGPLGIELRSGKGLPGSREVSITSSIGSPAQLSQMISEVTGLSGAGFTEFKMGSGKVDDEEVAKVLNQLSKNSSKLRLLDLAGLSGVQLRQHRSTIWTLAMYSKNLTSLNLDLIDDGTGEETVLEIPDSGKREVELTHLDLLVQQGVSFSIGDLARWVGKSLVNVKLGFPVSRSIVVQQGMFSSIIVPSMQTLKSISLAGFKCRENELSNLNASSLEFPNLEKLNINSTSAHIFGFFSDVKADRLHRLHFWGGDPELQASVASFVKLLKKIQGHVTELNFAHDREVIFEPPSEELSFSFTKLQRLSVPLQKDGFVEWFSKFHFPNLTHIDSESTHHYEVFVLRSPKLVYTVRN